MKICFLSPNFPPKRCGIGDYTYFLANLLAEIGNKVVVITSLLSNESKFAGECEKNLNLEVIRAISNWGFGAFLTLKTLIKSINPDIVHIQYCPHLYNKRGLVFMVNFFAFYLRVSS